ncbi:chromosome segregation ATPase [Pseudomonas oryzihabitans]
MMALLEQYRAAALTFAAVVLLGLGGAVGGGVAYWLTADHYRPVVEKLQDKVTASASTLASCRTTSSTLEGQVGQQNLALADLRRAAEDRAKRAEPIQQQAAKAAAGDYQAANRLQQERTGGDPATAAAAIIDKELGL